MDEWEYGDERGMKGWLREGEGEEEMEGCVPHRLGEFCLRQEMEKRRRPEAMERGRRGDSPRSPDPNIDDVTAGPQETAARRRGEEDGRGSNATVPWEEGGAVPDPPPAGGG